MVIDYCNFDNITVRNYLFEISKTKLSINRTKFSAIESFNGILIDIYGVSILFMNDIITATDVKTDSDFKLSIEQQFG